MSTRAYLIHVLRILLAAGLFAAVLFGDADRSQAAQRCNSSAAFDFTHAKRPGARH